MKYEPKYIKTGNREIKTVDEAIAILMAATYCADCRSCPIRQYENTEGKLCSKTIDKARRFVNKYYDIAGRERFEQAIAIYEIIGSRGDVPEEETEPLNTCASCQFGSESIFRGYKSCDSFHGIVKETECCTRYLPKIG